MEQNGNLYFTHIDLKIMTRYALGAIKETNDSYAFYEVCKKKVNVQYVEKLLENKYITLNGGDFKNSEYYNSQP